MAKIFSVLLVLTLTFLFKGFGQTSSKPLTKRTISGVVRDSNGIVIQLANVKLTIGKEEFKSQTNKFGTFTFKDVGSAEFTLSVSHVSYGKFTQRYLMNDTKSILSVPPIILSAENMMQEVYVSKEGPIYKKDTVEFMAQDYIVRDYARLQDLLKKIPGITLGRDGTVYFNGEQVKNAKFNGVRYFSGDVTSIIKELPADIIERIQIIDDYGDESRGEVIKDEAVKTLNVVTKENKSAGTLYSLLGEVANKNRNNIEAGYKSIDNIEQKSLKFSRATEPLGLAHYNDVGSIAERSTDITVAGSPSPYEHGKDDIYAGTISKNIQLGRFKVDNYYNGIHRNSDGTQRSFSENTINNELLVENNRSLVKSVNNKHRLKSIFKYLGKRKDIANFSVDFDYEKVDQDLNSLRERRGAIIMTDSISRATKTIKPTFTLNGDYDPKVFSNAATSLTFHYFLKLNQAKNTESYQQFIKDFDDVSWDKNETISNKYLSLSSMIKHRFSEKLGGRLSFDGIFSTEDNNRNVFDNLNKKNIDSISQHFEEINKLYRLKGNLVFKYIRNVELDLGGIFQNIDNTGHFISNNKKIPIQGWFLSPTIKVNVQIKSRSGLEVSYLHNIIAPSFKQIYPLPMMDNISTVSYGNPDLEFVKRHDINFKFNHYFNRKKINIALLGSLKIWDNQIVSQQILTSDPNYGSRIQMSFMNTQGNRNFTLNNILSKSFGKNVWLVKLEGLSQWNQTPFYNGETKDIAKTNQLLQILGISTSFLKFMDIEIGARYEYQSRESQTMSRRKNNLLSVDIKSALYITKDFRVSFNMTQRNLEGFGINEDRSLFVFNSSIEKRIFKRKNAVIAISCIDLFKQNIYPVRQYDTFGYQDRFSNTNSRFFKFQFLWEPQMWKSSKFKSGIRAGDGSFK